MRVLAINCGSSTLKFRLFEVEDEGSAPDQKRSVADGWVEHISSGQPSEAPQCNEGRGTSESRRRKKRA